MKSLHGTRFFRFLRRLEQTHVEAREVVVHVPQENRVIDLDDLLKIWLVEFMVNDDA